MKQTKFPEHPILLVDDEESWLVSFETMLARHGKINNVVLCSDSEKVMDLLAEHTFSLILLDYGMPGTSGDELLKSISLLYPELPVTVLTGHDQVDIAVYCKNLGAHDYFVKTQDGEILTKKILKTLNSLRPKEQVSPETLSDLFSGVIASTANIKKACQNLAEQVGSDETLLLVGEDGVGKYFLAHRIMDQARGNIQVIDTVSDDDFNFLDESFLQGLLTNCHNGHVYLNHVDDLDQKNQLALLKFLQQKLRIRFICAVSDLSTAKDKLREDLFNLLTANMIEIPPLRSRKEDLPELTSLFLQQAADEYGKKKPTPPPELDMLLQSYNFPGNVAELKNMVSFAVYSHKSRKLSMEPFKQLMASNQTADRSELVFPEILPTIEEIVEMLVDEAEKRADGNQSIMASMLGISRQALNRRLNNRKK